MNIRKAMKAAPALFLVKSHVKGYTRRSKSGAVTQVNDYETARQAAAAASKKANDHQAKQDWNNPDTKGGAKLHAEAGMKHLQAMKAAHDKGDSESMREHYYKASHHLASVDHHLSFNPKDKKARAAHAEKIADALSKVANAHKVEHNHRSLDYGSSIHLLAAEHHNRAASANYNSNNDEKGRKHREAAIEHGKKTSEIAGVSVSASEHAWNASDRARIGGDQPGHHMDAMKAHQKAAELNYDPEGRAEHEKAAEHHKEIMAEKAGEVKHGADKASDKADRSGSAEDHKAAMKKHQEAAKVQPEHLVRYHKEMAAYHKDEAKKAGLEKSHVKAFTRRTRSGASSFVSEYERDAIAEGRKPSIGEFLHGREYDYDGIHGHWKHTPAKVHKNHPLYGENWKEPEKLEHVPSAKGKQSKPYQAIRQKLGDDFVSDPGDDRIVEAAMQAGYGKKYPADDSKQKTVQALVDGIETVSGTMLKNPALKEHHTAIARKVSALKANPSAKAAHQVASDLKLIIESAQKGVKKSYAERLVGLAKSFRR